MATIARRSGMIATVSARYEALRFLGSLFVGVGVAVILASVWAVLRGGPFRHSIEIGLYLVGALAFILAAGESPSQRAAENAGWMQRWAYSGIFATKRDNPPASTIRPMVVLGSVGVILIALGLAISQQRY